MQDVNFSYNVDRADAGRLRVGLKGSLAGTCVDPVESELRAALETDGERVGVLFDLTGVIRCDVAARKSLLRIQEHLRESGCRTVYLANRPRIRGIALWVVHVAADGNARSVATMFDAEDWLHGEGDRLEIFEKRATGVISRLKRKKGGRR